MEGVGWIMTIILGGLAGWIAEKIMKSEMGLISNIILGIVGALVLNAILGCSTCIPPAAAGSWQLDHRHHRRLHPDLRSARLVRGRQGVKRGASWSR